MGQPGASPGTNRSGRTSPPRRNDSLSKTKLNRGLAGSRRLLADAGGELLRLTYRELPHTVRTLTGWDLEAEGE
jgi:hypothetical protein